MNYNLERFVSAQEYDYPRALKEIKSGFKESHWMWYIFPQLKQLGKSYMAKQYGIDSLAEAKEYLAHPILGERLKEISEALLLLDENDPYKVMGKIDGIKLCSCMTLFAEVSGYDSVFGKIIDKYYGGKKDRRTIQILKDSEKEHETSPHLG